MQEREDTVISCDCIKGKGKEEGETKRNLGRRDRAMGLRAGGQRALGGLMTLLFACSGPRGAKMDALANNGGLRCLRKSGVH
jgi:hypothetical protein